jgi:hypothetical protein
MKKFIIGGVVGFVLFLIIGLFIFFGILAGIGGSADAVVKEIESQENKLVSDANKLKAKDVKLKGENITGSITNTLDYEIKSMTVEIDFYDKSGAKVDSSVDYVENLEPGKVWKFKIWAYEHQEDSYKLRISINNW